MRAINYITILFLPLLVAGQTLSELGSWAYQLQELNIQDVVNNNSFELIVMDYSADGSGSTAYTQADIQAIKSSGKKAICYISIGEAETYRDYWNTSWDADGNGIPDTGAPQWLGTMNPEWEGNYKVRFWDPEWQTIIFNYVSTIQNQGFDGIYMDIIDAYYYWAEDVSEEPNADAYMVEFLSRIRNHINANSTERFYMFPQNGEYIIWEPHVSDSLRSVYFDAIDAIGVEDVFFYGDLDENNTYAPDTDRIDVLHDFIDAGKPVFSIEYLTQTTLINQYKVAAENEGFVAYVSTRNLDVLYDGFTLDTFPKNYIPASFALGTPFPNPFNSNVQLPISVVNPTQIQINIYNIRGEMVQSYSPSTLQTGDNIITISFKELPSGSYYYKIYNDNTSKEGSLLFLK